MMLGITGGLGFIGSHTVEAALNFGHKVVVLDNYRRALNVLESHPQLTVHRGDIRNPADLEIFSGCDVVINLAAESSVMRCEQDPQYAWETNVGGVANLARLCLEKGIGLIQASSREVYGEVTQLPVLEEAPYGAKNQYGCTKQEAEILLLGYRQQGLSVSILRFSNVTGTKDEGRLLPLWLTAANRGQPLIVYGGTQMIDFVPVKQVVDALLQAATVSNVGPLNVASGKAVSIKMLAERIQQLHSTIKIEEHPAREAEVTGYQADVTKMVSLGILPPEDPLCDLEILSAYYV